MPVARDYAENPARLEHQEELLDSYKYVLIHLIIKSTTFETNYWGGYGGIVLVVNKCTASWPLLSIYIYI